MTSWSHFEHERDADGVVTITLNRPETLNSLTFDVYADLERATREMVHDPESRVLVLAGRGRGFCSGGDINEIMGPLLERDMEGVVEFTRMTCEVVRNLRRMPQPVVAAVDGTAAGAGAVLALASDLRIVGQGVKMHFLFTKVGLGGADMGAAWLLPRVIGRGRASEVLLFGEPITSDQALAWGLANRVVPVESVLETAKAWARHLANGPREALQATKRALESEASMSLEAALEHEVALQATLLKGHDHREFYEAARAKRAPRWRD